MYEKLNKIEKIIFDVLSVCLVLFYSYSAVLKPASTQYHRGIYVIITYVLIFLAYKSKHKFMRIVDYLLILLSIFSVGYWILNFEVINYRTGAETPFDMFVAIIGVLIGIELARRVVGNVFVIMGAYCCLFTGSMVNMRPNFFHMPAIHFRACVPAFSTRATVCSGSWPMFWPPMSSCSFIFGAFLEKCGAQKFFVDFPLAAVGHKIGGPGKVAVIASGLFGSISGSAIANVVSTGSFTIPMMKKAGFRPHIAGGIEPAASISGMFMPPIMGAGGFIMAELTGVPYSRIMLIAIFPALMYVFSVYNMVHWEAKMHNIKGEKSEQSAMEILKTQWYYTLPLIVITILMLMGFSPGYSAILGLVSCIVISWFRKETRIGPKEFVEAARAGTESSLKIGATVGVIGIIIGVLTFSGLVLTFADIVIELAGGSLILTIFLIALASLVLGMGVPVTAAYLITAVVAVPALVHLGVNEIASHMIVYWLSQDSNITPPVCIAAFAGATIAKANMWRTAFASFKFAKFLYLGPFLFGYVPAFSLDGSHMDIVKAFGLILVGTYAYSWILSGIWIKQLVGVFKKAPAS